MAAFATLALPQTINTGFYQYPHFEADATVGVWMNECYSTGPITWALNIRDTGFRSDLDGRLWDMDVTLKNGTSTTIGPANAGEYKSYDVSSIYGNTAHLHEWRRITVPGAEENDRLWMRVLITVTHATTVAGDRGPKFRFWFGRERGESVTVDCVRCPVMWVKSPAAVRGGETNYQASKRSRLLIPQVSPNFNGNVGSNLNFYVHSAIPVNKTITGPNLQHLQLFGVCNVNNLDANYLRAFWGYTQDTAGWHKAYKYEGLNHTPSTSAYAKFAPVYYPRFGKAFARGRIENQLIPESVYGNTGASPYPFYYTSDSASTESWWCAVTQEYRDWYRAAVNPPLLSTDPNRGNHAKTGGLWYGTIQIVNKTSYQQGQFYDRCLSLMRDWMTYLDSSTHRAADYCVWHQQSTGRDFNLHMPGPFGDGQYSEDWVRVARQSRSYGIRPSSYSMSEAWTPLTSRWNEVMSGQFLICNRNGTTNYGFQIADPAVRTALVNGYSMLAAKSGCNSFYMDLGSGSGATPSYSTPGENAGPYGVIPRHGNYEHTSAKIDMLQRIRASTQGGDSHNIIASESTEEALGPYLDLTQDGYNIAPDHLFFGEWTIYNNITYPGVPDVSLTDFNSTTRNLTPPLWQLVHHEWSPTGRFGCMPLNIGLSTNTNYHPDGGFTGITGHEDMVDMHCLIASCLFANGIKQLFDYDSGNDYPLVETQGATVRSHPTYDPNNAGGLIFDFYKKLFQWRNAPNIGSLLNSGKLMRYANVNVVTTSANPVAAARTISPDAWRAFPYLYDAGTWVTAVSAATWDVVPSMTSTTQSFEVPWILSSIWKTHGDESAAWLVMVNWARLPALVNYSLFPGHYFSPTPPNNDFIVSELAMDGTLTPLGTLGATPGNWQLGNTAARAIDIGAFSARHVRVFKLVPS